MRWDRRPLVRGGRLAPHRASRKYYYVTMTCRSCGQRIADNAIVCYKCGTPTAVPAAPAPRNRRRSARGMWIVIVVLAATAAAAVWWWVRP